jgi:hypothetical protein
MFRIVVILALLLPAAALAQTQLAAPTARKPAVMAPEPLSRAQIRQMIADRGYFEIDGLEQAPDGTWHCTALAGPGQRVALTLDRNGAITENDVPATSQR